MGLTETAPEPPSAPETGAGFMEKARRTLQEVFGFPAFRDGQRRALEALQDGKDCLLIMPTGSGKSLCYQVPALILPGVTLVISPLIALMKDQVDGLALRGVPVTFVNSSLTLDEQWARIESMKAGAYKLVYVAPERFRNRAFCRSLAGVKVSLLAVDEAHCISQWGHDFRPDYRRLRQVRELLRGVQTIALTATATPEVQDDIALELKMSSPERIVTGFDRPNLFYRVKKTSGGAQKLEALQEFIAGLLREHDGDGTPSGIVYAGTRKHAEEVADFLNERPLRREPEDGREEKKGPVCRAYHAGLENDQRREVQEDFMEGRLPWVAATNAFGMGVDKADIRCVVHYDLPGSIEAYYQEVGRAGRDGLPAQCLLLFSEADRHLQEFFIEGSNPSPEMITGVYRFLWSLEENPIFQTLADLENRFRFSEFTPGRANPLAFRTSVVVLERAEALERLDNFDNLAEVRQLPGKSWQENPFKETATVRRALWESLAKVFERSDGEAVQFHPERWAAELEMPLESLRRGLHQMAEDGWLEYLPPFRGRAIRLPEERRKTHETGVDFKALEKRRQRDEERLEKVIAYCRSRDCRRNLILRHFGEKVPSGHCSHCDRCRTGHQAVAQRIPPRPLDEEEFTKVRKILSGVARAAGRCGRGKIIQMLLGSQAQGIFELGLAQLSTYGILQGMPREEVRRLVGLLEEAGCLEEAGERYPLLCLTERGRRVMQAKERLDLPLPVSQPPPPRPEPGGAPPEESLPERDEALFQRLRHLRRELAGRYNVPAFRVFSDRTLKAMARARPATEEEMLSVPGVGKVTLSLFGQEFLREINLYRAEDRTG
ncbi:MAG: RecQ family ATP-dependent DNA helicase [Planctomycetes bacterium]|nr:RecQ family ATP-dependent DNA helicase [Planctomycetota bacterium]